MWSHKGDGGNHYRLIPHGLTWTWAQVGCGKGGRKDSGNGGRRKHAARAAELSGGGWQVEGVDNVQVDGVLRQERRWGAGAKDTVDTTPNGH